MGCLVRLIHHGFLLERQPVHSLQRRHPVSRKGKYLRYDSRRYQGDIPRIGYEFDMWKTDITWEHPCVKAVYIEFALEGMTRDNLEEEESEIKRIIARNMPDNVCETHKEKMEAKRKIREELETLFRTSFIRAVVFDITSSQ